MNIDPDRVLFDVEEMEEALALVKKAEAERDAANRAREELADVGLQVLARATTAERELEAALARITDLSTRLDETTTELMAYQLGDSDRDLIGEDGMSLLEALRRIEDEDIPISRQTSVRRGKRWLVGDTGLGDTLLEALAASEYEGNRKPHVSDDLADATCISRRVVAIAFLQKSSSSEPYLSNAITRLAWWARDGYQGNP